MVYTLFCTRQFNDRVTDGDNGKVALTGSRLLVECNADLQTKQRNGKRFAISQEFNCKHPAQINIQYAQVLQITYIQDAQQLIDNGKDNVQQSGLQFSADHIVHIGSANKATSNLGAFYIFQGGNCTSADFCQIGITGKAASHRLLSIFGPDNRSRPEAGDGAIFNVSAEQIQRTHCATKQFVQNIDIVNVRNAALAQVTHKATGVVRSFHVA